MCVLIQYIPYPSSCAKTRTTPPLMRNPAARPPIRHIANPITFFCPTRVIRGRAGAYKTPHYVAVNMAKERFRFCHISPANQTRVFRHEGRQFLSLFSIVLCIPSQVLDSVGVDILVAANDVPKVRRFRVEIAGVSPSHLYKKTVSFRATRAKKGVNSKSWVGGVVFESSSYECSIIVVAGWLVP